MLESALCSAWHLSWHLGSALLQPLVTTPCWPWFLVFGSPGQHRPCLSDLVISGRCVPQGPRVPFSVWLRGLGSLGRGREGGALSERGCVGSGAGLLTVPGVKSLSSSGWGRFCLLSQPPGLEPPGTHFFLLEKVLLLGVPRAVCKQKGELCSTKTSAFVFSTHF